MRNLSLFTAGTAALIALSAPATATAAQAPSESFRQPEAASHLILIAQETRSGDPLDVAYLECAPPGGTHPTPREACGELRKAGGDFRKLDHKRGRCTREFNPVRLYAYGNWQRKDVKFVSKVYPNRCEANLATANVFKY
ncbi:subtilase-type protease inhibitor [Streptomyces sp. RB5]|uniref:Subtilase-type protease inhibitor n=1 Tax=Streptomyces smaragdinus TaxID=2585196 RepID=A0A7K0CI13_9ACTN|nr:SSI family serine proteinase inhibitor [Streptomyces smaragdinus]MQY13118.1 subtilase-type protease inhibitor [Streptomyces smaragdinus]